MEVLSQPNRRYQNKILLADDDLFIRSLVKKIVGAYVDIETLSDADNVVDAYMETFPAALMIDLHMPKRSGFRILDEVLARDPDAYVVVISADSTKENVIEARKRGAKGFITKPFHKEKLFNLIHTCPNLRFRHD